MSEHRAGDPALGQRTHLSARAKARKRAVDILFEADLRDTDPVQILAAYEALGEPPVREYTVELVRGVAGDLGALDEVIKESLQGSWTLERMPRVDRTLARVGAYELTRTAVPVNVVIAEATQLATELSTDSSPTFVNALLARLSAAHPRS